MTSEKVHDRDDAFFKALFEHTAYGTSVIASDGTILYQSPAGDRFLGLDDAEGKSFFSYLHPDDVDRARDAFTESEKSPEKAISIELRVKYKDSTWHYVEGVGRNMVDDPTVGGFVFSFRDITRIKEAEEELRRSRDLQEAVNELLGIALENVSIEEFLSKAIDLVVSRDWLCLDQAGCALLQEDGSGTLVLNTHKGVGGEIVEACDRVPLGYCFCGRALSGDSVQFHGDSGKKKAGSQDKALGHYYVVVKHGHQLLGGMSFWPKQGHERSQTTQRFLDAIANALAGALHHRIATQKLVHHLQHDHLTGLGNRSMLLDRIGEYLGKKRKKPFSLLVLDIDRFKVLTESLGHVVGDEILNKIARRLLFCSDASDLVVRLGGDEFVVLMDGVSDKAQASRRADEVQTALSEQMDIQSRTFEISASMGIVMHSPEYKHPEEILRDADIAMYRAKKKGQGRYEVFETKMRVQSLSQLDRENEMRQAVNRREFVVYYQPIVSMYNRRLIGFEALVRWHHPTRGLVMPGEFIPPAEESGLIMKIGERVLEDACIQLKKWQDQKLGLIHASVNLSARQFGHVGLVKQVSDVLKSTGLEPRRLALEITESLAASDPKLVVDVFTVLHRMGVKLYLDDFGIGNSSMAYLKRFPVDVIKIDRSFIRDIPKNTEDSAITTAIIAMGRSLGLTVLAEGVEEEAQLKFLKEKGCEAAQGFFFGKAIPADEATNLIIKGVL